MHAILCYYINISTHMNIKNAFISIAVTLLLGGMVACSESSSFPQFPTDDHYIAPPVDVDTTGMNIPSEAITVSEARKIGRELGPGGTSTGFYYIKGFIKSFNSKHEDGVKQYGNASFYIQDTHNSTSDFMAYQVYGIGGEKFTSLDQLAVGDYVVIYGKITNYNGTIETTGKGEAYVYASNNLMAYPEKDYYYLQSEFAEGLGDWKVEAHTGSADIWTTGSDANGSYVQAKNDLTDSEVWLVSPSIDLKAMEATHPKLTFSHYHMNTADAPAQLRLMVKTDATAWQEVIIPQYGTGTVPPRYTESKEIDMTDYISSATQIAFVYSSNTTSAPTWRIRGIKVSELRRSR